MNKKNSLVFLMVSGLLLFGGAAFAFMGQPEWKNEAVQQALENGDFEAWQEAMMGDLTQEKFQQMQEWYENRQNKQQQMEQVMAAIEAGDYNAWKAAMEQFQKPDLTDLITEDNFDTFVAMHNAMQNGDYETANQLREQLGLQGKGFGMRHRFRNMNHFGSGCGCNQNCGSTQGSGSAF